MSGLVAAAAAGACGGSVVFVEDDGAGGTSSSSSTAKSTASSSAKSTSTVSATQTSTSVTTVTVTTGPIEPFCNFGDITTQCDDCAAQASNGPCLPFAEACLPENGCFDYANCVSQCFSDPNCCANCINFFPEGAVTYSEFLHCVTCDICPVECAEATPGFCD